MLSYKQLGKADNLLSFFKSELNISTVLTNNIQKAEDVLRDHDKIAPGEVPNKIDQLWEVFSELDNERASDKYKFNVTQREHLNTCINTIVEIIDILESNQDDKNTLIREYQKKLSAFKKTNTNQDNNIQKEEESKKAADFNNAIMEYNKNQPNALLAVGIPAPSEKNSDLFANYDSIQAEFVLMKSLIQKKIELLNLEVKKINDLAGYDTTKIKTDLARRIKNASSSFSNYIDELNSLINDAKKNNFYNKKKIKDACNKLKENSRKNIKEYHDIMLQLQHYGLDQDNKNELTHKIDHTRTTIKLLAELEKKLSSQIDPDIGGLFKNLEDHIQLIQFPSPIVQSSNNNSENTQLPENSGSKKAQPLTANDLQKKEFATSQNIRGYLNAVIGNIRNLILKDPKSSENLSQDKATVILDLIENEKNKRNINLLQDKPNVIKPLEEIKTHVTNLANSDLKPEEKKTSIEKIRTLVDDLTNKMNENTSSEKRPPKTNNPGSKKNTNPIEATTPGTPHKNMPETTSNTGQITVQVHETGPELTSTIVTQPNSSEGSATITSTVSGSQDNEPKIFLRGIYALAGYYFDQENIKKIIASLTKLAEEIAKNSIKDPESRYFLLQIMLEMGEATKDLSIASKNKKYVHSEKLEVLVNLRNNITHRLMDTVDGIEKLNKFLLLNNVDNQNSINKLIPQLNKNIQSLKEDLTALQESHDKLQPDNTEEREKELILFYQDDRQMPSLSPLPEFSAFKVLNDFFGNPHNDLNDNNKLIIPSLDFSDIEIRKSGEAAIFGLDAIFKILRTLSSWIETKNIDEEPFLSARKFAVAYMGQIFRSLIQNDDFKKCASPDILGKMQEVIHVRGQLTHDPLAQANSLQINQIKKYIDYDSHLKATKENIKLQDKLQNILDDIDNTLSQESIEKITTRELNSLDTEITKHFNILKKLSGDYLKEIQLLKDIEEFDKIKLTLAFYESGESQKLLDKVNKLPQAEWGKKLAEQKKNLEDIKKEFHLKIQNPIVAEAAQFTKQMEEKIAEYEAKLLKISNFIESQEFSNPFAGKIEQIKKKITVEDDQETLKQLPGQLQEIFKEIGYNKIDEVISNYNKKCDEIKELRDLSINKHEKSKEKIKKIGDINDLTTLEKYLKKQPETSSKNVSETSSTGSTTEPVYETENISSGKIAEQQVGDKLYIHPNEMTKLTKESLQQLANILEKILQLPSELTSSLVKEIDDANKTLYALEEIKKIFEPELIEKIGIADKEILDQEVKHILEKIKSKKAILEEQHRNMKNPFLNLPGLDASKKIKLNALLEEQETKLNDTFKNIEASSKNLENCQNDLNGYIAHCKYIEEIRENIRIQQEALRNSAYKIENFLENNVKNVPEDFKKAFRSFLKENAKTFDLTKPELDKLKFPVKLKNFYLKKFEEFTKEFEKDDKLKRQLSFFSDLIKPENKSTLAEFLKILQEAIRKKESVSNLIRNVDSNLAGDIAGPSSVDSSDAKNKKLKREKKSTRTEAPSLINPDGVDTRSDQQPRPAYSLPLLQHHIDSASKSRDNNNNYNNDRQG